MSNDATQQLITQQHPNEDAFSSDSEDNEDEVLFQEALYPVSEFDKALRSGVPNRGAASFDDGDFYRDAEDSLIKEVLSTEDNVVVFTPPRTTKVVSQPVQAATTPPPPTTATATVLWVPTTDPIFLQQYHDKHSKHPIESFSASVHIIIQLGLGGWRSSRCTHDDETKD
jgi:hypothetical protein